MSEEKINKIEAVSEELESKKIDGEIEPVKRVTPDKEQFDALMNLDKQRSANITTEPTNKVSLMEQIRELNNKVDAVKRASPDTIVAQAEQVIHRIEEVKTQLATPNLELKNSVQNLLKNKLTHIDESLKVALNRAGVEYVPQTPVANNLTNPIERFIGFLTHGQHQLQNLAGDVKALEMRGKNLTPGAMIAIQVKVGFIQQEIEFFSAMLNKSLESVKTIMNVQI